MRVTNIKKLTFMAMMIAFAMILSYIESLIPMPLPIPGAKVGLSNIITLLVLYMFGTRESLIVLIARIILVGFMFSNAFAIIYSLAGGLLALGAMALLKRFDKFHIISVSIVGGIAHNLGQVIVAAFALDTVYVAGYFVPLYIAGIVAGVVVGIVSMNVYKYTYRIVNDRTLSRG